MARLNVTKLNELIGWSRPRTHEGAPARQHQRGAGSCGARVLACMLWENEFYEDGVEIAGRIAELVPKVDAEKVAALAVEARDADEAASCAAAAGTRDGAARDASRAGGGDAGARDPACRRACRVRRHLLEGRARAALGAGEEGTGRGFPRSSTSTRWRSTTAPVPVKLRDVLFLCAREAARRSAGRAVEAAGRGRARRRPTPGRLHSPVGRQTSARRGTRLLGERKLGAWPAAQPAQHEARPA